MLIVDEIMSIFLWSKVFRAILDPLLSEKLVPNEKITLIDNGKIAQTKEDTAHILNIFVSDIVTNLKAPKYTDYDPITNNLTFKR